MNKFLELSHKALAMATKYEKIHIVLGNESCDLDSAISALIYAYYLYKQFFSTNMKTIVVPVLNINEEEFPLRTETKYFLTKHSISHLYLTFRNHINLSKLSKINKLRLTLVDHHDLPEDDLSFNDCIVEVLDHRPLDPNSKINLRNATIEPVGSCCTLVANKIISNNCSILTSDLGNLLHGAIILDTVNFNIDANRFKDLDMNIVNILENMFKIVESREDIYNELIKARSDISSLSSYQVLHKDMKIIHGIPIPGVPMLFAEFILFPDAIEALKKFCEKFNSKVFIPMGLVTRNGKVYRDIAVFAMENCEINEKLVDILKSDENLGLEEIQTNINGLTLFKQNNITMSRKQIVPIIKNVIKEYTKI